MPPVLDGRQAEWVVQLITHAGNRGQRDEFADAYDASQLWVFEEADERAMALAFKEAKGLGGSYACPLCAPVCPEHDFPLVGTRFLRQSVRVCRCLACGQWLHAPGTVPLTQHSASRHCPENDFFSQ